MSFRINGLTSILRMLFMNGLCFNRITEQFSTHGNCRVILMKKSYLWKQGESWQTVIQATPCLDKSASNMKIIGSVGINIYAP